MSYLGTDLILGAAWFTAAGGLGAIAWRMNRPQRIPGARPGNPAAITTITTGSPGLPPVHAWLRARASVAPGGEISAPPARGKVIPLRLVRISDDGTETEHA